MIRLRSEDGEEARVERAVAAKSETLRLALQGEWLETQGEEPCVTLPMTGPVLHVVVAHLRGEGAKLDTGNVFAVMEAAHYLGI